MPKVTSKLQITLPKALATQYGIEPGDEIEFVAAGDAIRLTPKKSPRPKLSLAERIRIWDQANAALTNYWESEGEARRSQLQAAKVGRDWTREDLYDRVNRYFDRRASDADPVDDNKSGGSS